MSDETTVAEPLPVMTDEEREQRAIEIVRNEWFIAFSDEDIRCAFSLMVMGFGSEVQIPPNLGLIMERYDKAGDRGINGRPFFFSCQLLAQEDVIPLFQLVGQKSVALGTMTEAENAAAWWNNA